MGSWIPSSLSRVSIFIERVSGLGVFCIGNFAFAACDDDCTNGVAKDINCGAAHVEESVGDPYNTQCLDRETDCRKDDGDGDKAGGGDSGNANTGCESEENDGYLLTDVERGMPGSGVELSNEENNYAFIECGAVHIDGGAEGEGKGTGFFRDAGSLFDGIDG